MRKVNVEKLEDRLTVSVISGEGNGDERYTSYKKQYRQGYEIFLQFGPLAGRGRVGARVVNTYLLGVLVLRVAVCVVGFWRHVGTRHCLLIVKHRARPVDPYIINVCSGNQLVTMLWCCSLEPYCQYTQAQWVPRRDSVSCVFICLFTKSGADGCDQLSRSCPAIYATIYTGRLHLPACLHVRWSYQARLTSSIAAAATSQHQSATNQCTRQPVIKSLLHMGKPG